MSRHALFLPAFLLAISPVLAYAADVCPVTSTPNPRFVPSSPEPLPRNSFWFGTNDFWTALPVDGIWHWSSRTYQGLSRLSLWKAGYDGDAEPRPEIAIDLKRLDAEGPPAHSQLVGANANVNGLFRMASGITFPSIGCWQVIVSHGGHSVTFVASVQ